MGRRRRLSFGGKGRGERENREKRREAEETKGRADFMKDIRSVLN